jgi:hypothetical protein
VTLTPAICAAIQNFDFARVRYLTAPMIVKDPAAAPALSKVLGLIPDEAPPGITPDAIQEEEMIYVNQLRQIYSETTGVDFASADDVLAHFEHGDHLRLQRTRFFEAASFIRFHRDNTEPDALRVFQGDVYHGVIDVYDEAHASRLHRVNAVMKHAGATQVALLGRLTRVQVRQGMCHHLVNEKKGRLKWIP